MIVRTVAVAAAAAVVAGGTAAAATVTAATAAAPSTSTAVIAALPQPAEMTGLSTLSSSPSSSSAAAVDVRLLPWSIDLVGALSQVSHLRDVAGALHLAHQWRQEEARARTPFLLLRILALTRAFELQEAHPYPRPRTVWTPPQVLPLLESLSRSELTKITSYGKRMLNRHVGPASSAKPWRGTLAWKLFLLQRSSDYQHQLLSLLAAMSQVSPSILQVAVHRLWPSGQQNPSRCIEVLHDASRQQMGKLPVLKLLHSNSVPASPCDDRASAISLPVPPAISLPVPPPPEDILCSIQQSQQQQQFVVSNGAPITCDQPMQSDQQENRRMDIDLEGEEEEEEEEEEDDQDDNECLALLSMECLRPPLVEGDSSRSEKEAESQAMELQEDNQESALTKGRADEQQKVQTEQGEQEDATTRARASTSNTAQPSSKRARVSITSYVAHQHTGDDDAGVTSSLRVRKRAHETKSDAPQRSVPGTRIGSATAPSSPAEEEEEEEEEEESLPHTSKGKEKKQQLREKTQNRDRSTNKPGPKQHERPVKPHASTTMAAVRGLNPRLNVDALDQHWRESYADRFRSLEARYPVLLRRVCPIDPSRAEQLLRAGHADAVAMAIGSINNTDQADATTAPIHEELARGLVDPSSERSVMQLCTETGEEVELVSDTVDSPDVDRVASTFQLAKGRRYFIADMPLSTANVHMQRVVDDLASSGHAYLASVLLGGVFQYLDYEHVHGVADWTTSYHLDRAISASTSTARSSNRRRSSNVTSVSATAPSSSPLHPLEIDSSPYPIYFHCETHRAGAVNWRFKDARIQVDSGGGARVLPPLATASQLAYWICVHPEVDNVCLFRDTMKEMLQRRQQSSTSRKGEPVKYSIDDKHAPSISSIEPLLRAGVVLTLLEQRERELVVLQPGTPHMVLTPAHACKTSRNWMTSAALLGAACVVLRGMQGERAEWLADLCRRPLWNLLTALRRLHVAEPHTFRQLVCHPHSSAQLRFALSRAMALRASASSSHSHSQTRSRSEDAEMASELQTIARQISAWMISLLERSPPQLAPPSLSKEVPVVHSTTCETNRAQHESPLWVVATAAAAATVAVSPATIGVATDATATAATAPTTAVVSTLSSAGVAGEIPLEKDLAACSASFRAHLFRRLLNECPLLSVVREIDLLLMANMPLATTEEMCLGLEGGEGQGKDKKADGASSARSTAVPAAPSAQEQVHMINASHRQRNPRQAKLARLGQSAGQVMTKLIRLYNQQGRSLPDGWQSLVDLKEKVEQLVPPMTDAATSSWHALRQHAVSLTKQDVETRRRLLLRDLGDFLQPITADCPPPIHAAPESETLMRWRAVLCGPVNTRWQWVTLELRIEFPSDYPTSPPTITLVTPLFHPNFNLETGEICVNILTASGWSPSYRLHSVLAGLQRLLDQPNTASMLNEQASELYEEEEHEHQRQECNDLSGPFWSHVYDVHRQNMRQQLEPQQREQQEHLDRATAATMLPAGSTATRRHVAAAAVSGMPRQQTRVTSSAFGAAATASSGVHATDLADDSAATHVDLSYDPEVPTATSLQRLTNGQWLDDGLLGAACHILRRQFKDRLPEHALRYPTMLLPSSSTSRRESAQPERRQRAPLLPIAAGCPVLQILHVNGNHWVLHVTEGSAAVVTAAAATATTTVPTRPRVVLDGLLGSALRHNRELLEKVRCMWPTSDRDAVSDDADLPRCIEFRIPQPQVGEKDCGCFVIAWAVLWLQGVDPCSVRLDQRQLRVWLARGLQARRFDSPPHSAPLQPEPTAVATAAADTSDAAATSAAAVPAIQSRAFDGRYTNDHFVDAYRRSADGHGHTRWPYS